MKKYFKVMSLLLCMMAIPMTFVACGGDDDDNTPSGGGDKPGSAVSVQDLYGAWYGIDENSDKKVNVFIVTFEPNGKGNFVEIKAKAEHNWDVENDKSFEYTWTYENGTVTMTVGDEQMSADVLKKNDDDGTITIKRHLEEGESDEIKIYKIQNTQEAFLIFNDLRNQKLQGDGGEGGENNGQPDASIAEQDIMGYWYGIDENNDKRVNIFVMYFSEQGHGMYGEYKAKANEGWEPYWEGPIETQWILQNGILAMTGEVEGEQFVRVGEILKKENNTLVVRRHLEGDATDVVTLIQINEPQAVEGILNRLLADKQK